MAWALLRKEAPSFFFPVAFFAVASFGAAFFAFFFGGMTGLVYGCAV